jgi:serine/threonine-protein kinase
MNEPPRATNAAPTGVGTVLGGVYRIVQPLDEGGIGTVWLAEYGTPPRSVAVKLLRPEFAANAEVVARFEREVGAMAGLVHENIARAFDFGRTAAGELYMVMEHVEGESLRAALNRNGGWLPLERALPVARQIGSALARAHAVGVVHRDLKPENVIVADMQGAFPRLKILDFGMARVTQGLMAAGGPLTRVGAVFGTPAYMPPEQAAARIVDARADQYSLGIICYEMLAGRRPFVSDSPVEILQLHVRAPVPPLTELSPSVPPAVAAVIERMLAKLPDERFPDITSAIAALVAAASSAPPLAPVVHSPTVPKPPARSRVTRIPTVAIVMSALGSAAVLVTLVYLVVR